MPVDTPCPCGEELTSKSASSLNRRDSAIATEIKHVVFSRIFSLGSDYLGGLASLLLTVCLSARFAD